MNAYTWMMAIVLGLSLLMKGNKKGSRAFIAVAVIAMFCIMGLREATLIGGDSASSYLHEYQKISAMDWGNVVAEYSSYNAGFFYLMKLVSVTSDGNYQTFIIVISAFIMLCFGHFINRYSVSPIQSICYYWGLLLYIFMFSAEKQAIAMSILLLSFDAIMDKKPIRYLLLVLIAGQFHFPAFIFLPAYWIAKIRIDRYFILMLAIALSITFLFRDSLLNLMLRSYGVEDIEATMEGEVLLRTKSIIMISIVVAAVLLRKPSEHDRLYSILLKFMGMAIVFQTFCGYNNIFERLADYYFQFAVVFIPLVFERSYNNSELIETNTFELFKTAAPFIFGGYGIYRFSSMVKASSELMPYVFCFKK